MTSTPNASNSTSTPAKTNGDRQNSEPTQEVKDLQHAKISAAPGPNSGAQSGNGSGQKSQQQKTDVKPANKSTALESGRPNQTANHKAALNDNINSNSLTGHTVAKAPLPSQPTVGSKRTSANPTELINQNSKAGKETKDPLKGTKGFDTKNSSEQVESVRASDQTQSPEEQKKNKGSAKTDNSGGHANSEQSDDDDDDVIVGKQSSPKATAKKSAQAAASTKPSEQKQVVIRSGKDRKVMECNVEAGAVKDRVASLTAPDARFPATKAKDDSARPQSPRAVRPPIKCQKSEQQDKPAASSSLSSSNTSANVTSVNVAVQKSPSNALKAPVTVGTCSNSNASGYHEAAGNASITGNKDSDSDKDQSMGNKSGGRPSYDKSRAGEMTKRTNSTDTTKSDLMPRDGTRQGQGEHANVDGQNSQQQSEVSQDLSQRHVEVHGTNSATSDNLKSKESDSKSAESSVSTTTFPPVSDTSKQNKTESPLDGIGDDTSEKERGMNLPTESSGGKKENGKNDSERTREKCKQDIKSADGENKKLEKKDKRLSQNKDSSPRQPTDEFNSSTSGSRSASSGANSAAAVSLSDKLRPETPSKVSIDCPDAQHKECQSSSSASSLPAGRSDQHTSTCKFNSAMAASKHKDFPAKVVQPSSEVQVENEKPSDKLEVDEVLWAYVRFVDQRMEHSFQVELHPLDERKVVLFGKPDDVHKFHKFCAAGRLQRCVKLQALCIPEGYTAVEFHSSLYDLADGRIVVRLTNDRECCELIGKSTDIDDLIKKSKDKIRPREVKDVQSQPTVISSPASKATYSSAVQSPPRMAPPRPVSPSIMASHAPLSPSRMAPLTPVSSPAVFSAAGNSSPFAREILSTDFKLELSMLQSGVIVHVLTGDILQQRCEVIVSPSNSVVDLRSGLSCTIASAAGSKLRNECQKIMHTKKSLQVGDVIDTTAGNIPPPARHVIHACGPDRRMCRGLDVCHCLLRKTFQACLEHANAKKLRAKSIALPAISSGAFGVPPDVVGAAACEALIQFDDILAKLPRSGQFLQEIKFVNIDGDITRAMVAKFKEIMLKLLKSKPYPQSSKASSQTQNQSVHVYDREASSVSSDAEQLSYIKLQLAADRQGLCVVNIPNGGDSALDAIIHQLQTQGIHTWTNNELRKQAAAYMRRNPSVIDRAVVQLNDARDTTMYISRHEKPGTFCDLNMLKCVAQVIGKDIHVVYDNGCFQVLDVHPIPRSRPKPVFIGVVAESYYVSLRPKDPQSPSQNKPESQRLAVASSQQNSKYFRLQQVAEQNGFTIAGDQRDGDSLLRTIIEQLKDEGKCDYSVFSLRRKAVDYLRESLAGRKKSKIKKLFFADKKQSCLKKHSVPGTWCDETMLASVAEVICRDICLLDESGSIRVLSPNSSFGQTVTVGVASNGYCVGLLRDNSASGRSKPSSNSTSTQQRKRQSASPPSYSDDRKASDDDIEDDDFDRSVTPTFLHSEANASSSPDKVDDTDSCAICMDDVKNPKKLPCGHVFCADCIEQSFSYQKKCPCCGKIFGELKGDQPEGTMKVRMERMDLPGYPGCGTIVIDYDIPDGRQKESHPNPGEWYQGARRTAYLPDNSDGQEILELLRRAFDAGLIFTVGRSTTSGRENVVTWNDIHHKTKPNGPFGYPDPSYMSRVRDELAAKGITPLARVRSGSTDSSLPKVPTRRSRPSLANRSSYHS